MNEEELNKTTETESNTENSNISSPIDFSTPDVSTPETTEETKTEDEKAPIEEEAETKEENKPEENVESTNVEPTTTENVESTNSETPAPTEVTATEVTTPAVETPEAPIGENTAKLDAPADPTAKKSKKGLIIAIVVIVVIILALVLTGYIIEFKTGNKRLTSLSNGMFENIKVNDIKSNVKDQQSGAYNVELDADLKANSESLISGNIKLNGNYGVDLTNNDAYFTLDLENVVLNKESYLGSTGINASAELSNDTAYVGVEELFDKLISYKSDSFSEYWTDLKDELNGSSNEKYDVQAMIDGVKNATTAALTSVPNKQSIKSVDGLGTVNVVTITNSKENQATIIKTFVNKIADCSEIVKFYANTFSVEESEAKEAIQDLVNDYESDEIIFESIEFYTPLIGNDFKGLQINNVTINSSICEQGTNSISVIKDGSNYNINVNIPNYATAKLVLAITTGDESTVELSGEVKIASTEINTDDDGNHTCTKNGDSVLNIDIKQTTKNTATEQGYTFAVTGDLTPYNTDSETGKYSLELTFTETNTIDSTYTSSTLAKDSTVAYEELTAEDYQTIITNASTKLGKLGEMISYYLSSSSEDETTIDYDYYINDEDNDY